MQLDVYQCILDPVCGSNAAAGLQSCRNRSQWKHFKNTGEFKKNV